MEDTNYKTALSVFLQTIKAGTKYHEYSLDIGMTPPVLLGIGLPELPMTISVKIIDKIFYQHGIPEAKLKRLYDLIANPKSIFKSDSPHIDPGKVNPVVVITVEVKDANPILIAVHPNQIIGRRPVNQIKSMYDKPADMLQKWRGKGLLLWDAPQESGTAPISGTGPAPARPVVTVMKKRVIAKK